MSRRVLLAALVLAAFATTAAAAPNRRGPLQGRHRSMKAGELLVLVADPARLELRADGRVDATEPGLRAAFARHGLARWSALGSARPGRSRALVLHSDKADFDPRAAAAELAATGAFRAVAPNLTLDLYETVPDDIYLPYQWQIQSTEGTDAKLTQAWDLWQGDTSTVIAVVDNGLDISHEDLASQVWINRAEIPGNGIDDDGNGYIDDVKGWDFGSGDNDPSAEPAFEGGIDVGFHGSFVAGIAAAATNNGLGVAGAGWKCRFMALKVGVADSLSLSAVTEALEYVIDKHPAVVNMSFGTPDPSAAGFFQPLIDDLNAANVMCVAAAGNAGNDTLSYPAGNNGVLGVGAIDETGARADFSNRGPWVRISAPGATVFSSIANNYEIDFTSWIIYVFFFGYDGVNPYMFGDGTSFSSPLVAGIAGLVRSKFPSMTPAQVANHLIATGDVSAVNDSIGPRVNAFRALGEPTVGVAPEGLTVSSLSAAWPNPFARATTLAFTLRDAARVRLALYDPSGRVVRVLVDATLPPGRHAALWDGRSADGRALGSGVYFATLESDGVRSTRKLVLAR